MFWAVYPHGAHCVITFCTIRWEIFQHPETVLYFHLGKSDIFIPTFITHRNSYF